MTTDTYKYAAINKLKFVTPKGNIAAEDLFDLNKESTTGISLESVAAPIYAEQDSAPKRTLSQKATPVNEVLEVKLAILEDVFAYKTAENKAKLESLAKAERIKDIKAQLLANSKDALNNVSDKKLEKELRELEA